MRNLFICFLVFLNICPVFAEFISASPCSSAFRSPSMMRPYSTVTTNPYNNYNQYQTPVNNYYQPPEYNHRHHHKNYISPSSLNALEKYAFNRSYRTENELRRLERLENLAFGSVQSGDIISRYNNVEAAILNRPKETSTKQSLLNSIGNYFMGQATGFTPSLGNNYSYNPSRTNMFGNPDYNTVRTEQYSNGLWGNGYRINDQSYGSGSSLRILD